MTTPQARKKRRYFFIPLVLIGLAVAAIIVKLVKKEETRIESSGAIDIPFTKQGELWFVRANGADTITTIDIEVANDDASRARGLMYRNSLPSNAGMLFIQDAEYIQSFWMKNTYISLDMIFVNRDKKIVTIQANTEPLREWNYSSTEPALYVVETNAGFCQQHQINVGDMVEFEVAK